jgi:hypothetical protein
MDPFTRPLIGFGVHRRIVDGVVSSLSQERAGEGGVIAAH